MIENIVIGKPLTDPKFFFSKNDQDWEINQSSLTFYTEERFLPKILVELGIFKSNSDVKRNRPELFVNLTEPDYLELKIGRRRLYVVVGNI